ncbi:GspMb/PilO family protein [Kordiimonas sp.]|uniref:GspMb/PilO family protein n=1 Tax=Kordiimonas sp. TaxID=1970157 RepID=UPI003A94C490
MTKIKSVAAWSLLISICAGLFWLVAGNDIRAIAELEDVYLRKQMLLHRLQDLPRREDEIRRRLSDLGNEAAIAQLYQGEPNEIQVQIQRRLRQLANKSGISFNAMRPDGVSIVNEQLKRVSIRVNFVSTYSNMVSFLAGLEEDTPLHRVRSFVITREKTSTLHEPAILSVGLEISGFVRNGQSGEAS